MILLNIDATSTMRLERLKSVGELAVDLHDHLLFSIRGIVIWTFCHLFGDQKKLEKCRNTREQISEQSLNVLRLLKHDTTQN